MTDLCIEPKHYISKSSHVMEIGSRYFVKLPNAKSRRPEDKFNERQRAPYNQDSAKIYFPEEVLPKNTITTYSRFSKHTIQLYQK